MAILIRKQKVLWSELLRAVDLVQFGVLWQVLPSRRFYILAKKSPEYMVFENELAASKY